MTATKAGALNSKGIAAFYEVFCDIDNNLTEKPDNRNGALCFPLKKLFHFVKVPTYNE